MLLGGLGADVLDGGGANDTLDGGPGADEIAGGAGRDTADYGARAAPLRLTPGGGDGGADDGERGEGDRLSSDVERLVAGSGDDVLVTNGVDSELEGRDGNDHLVSSRGRNICEAAAAATPRTSPASRATWRSACPMAARRWPTSRAPPTRASTRPGSPTSSTSPAARATTTSQATRGPTG